MYVIRDRVQAYVSNIILYFSQNKIINISILSPLSSAKGRKSPNLFKPITDAKF